MASYSEIMKCFLGTVGQSVFERASGPLFVGILYWRQNYLTNMATQEAPMGCNPPAPQLTIRWAFWCDKDPQPHQRMFLLGLVWARHTLLVPKLWFMWLKNFLGGPPKRQGIPMRQYKVRAPTEKIALDLLEQCYFRSWEKTLAHCGKLFD